MKYKPGDLIIFNEIHCFITDTNVTKKILGNDCKCYEYYMLHKPDTFYYQSRMFLERSSKKHDS